MKTPVLFLCERNSIRSAMAEALMPGSASAGLSPDDHVDPFAVAVMAEEKIDISQHEPRPVDPKILAGTVIALSMAAFTAAKAWRSGDPFDLEYWELPGIPSHDAPRDVILDGYRRIRDALKEHLAKRTAV